MAAAAYLETGQARLAMARLRHGLTRHRNGWACAAADVDPRDLVAFRTLNALIKRGVARLEDGGQRASIVQQEN